MMKKQITIGSGAKADLAPMLVQIANRFKSSIYLSRGDVRVNVKSIMGMLSLGLASGDVIVVCAEGNDEDDAVAAIDRFLS